MLAHRGRGVAPQRERAEAGETLIEVLVSIVLLGTVVAAVLGGLFTLVTVSDSNNQRTQVGVGVQGFAEALKQPVADLEYIPCGTPTDYTTKLGTSADAVLATGENYTYTLLVEYWRGGSTFNSTCTLTAATTTTNATDDASLQRITITVKNGRVGSGAVSESLVILKRDARCPKSQGDYTNLDQGPC